MPEVSRPIDELTDHDDLLAAYKTLEAEAEESTETRNREVRRNWLFYEGKQYLDETNTPDDRVPVWKENLRITRNICFSNIETIRPIFQRGYPKLFISADFPEGQNPKSQLTDSQLASRMQEIFEAEHERRGEGIEVAKLIADVRIQGVGYRKVIYSEARNRVELPLLPFDSVLPDPFGTKANFEDHKYVIHRTEMDVADIERLYGVKEEDFGGDDEEDPKDRFGLVRRVRRMLANGSKSVEYKRKRYTVSELYYNEATNGAMAFNEKAKSLRFPRGRMIVVINRKLIPKQFMKMPIPFSHGEFPIVSYHAYPLSQTFLSRGDIDQLVSPQIAINVLYSQVIMNALLMSNAQWVVEQGAIPERWLTNQPGLVITTKPGKMDSIRKEQAAALPAGVFQMVKEMEEFAGEQVGATDVVQGQSPGSGASGVVVNSLQAAAMTRHAFGMEVLDGSHRRAAKLEVSTFQDWVRFNDPRLSKQRDLGEWLRFEEEMRQLLFDVDLESRSELPHNLVARLQWGQQMLELGVWDLTEFLDFTGIKVRESLRAKIDQLADGFIPGVPHQEQAALRAQAGQAQQLSQGQASGLPGLGGGVSQDQAIPQI